MSEATRSESREDPPLPQHDRSDITPTPSPHSLNQSRFRNTVPLTTGSRVLLLFCGLFLLAGFGLSGWLSPDPRGLGTHQQLGLAPCSFLLLTGKPCPSCGGTTAFAHFVRGQWPSAVRANAAAFVLALVCAAMMPWSWWSAATGRLIAITNVERAILILVILMAGLFALQWGLTLLADN